MITGKTKARWEMVILLLVGSGLGILQLEQPLTGFYLDEASESYDAFSLWHTGYDQHGEFFPLALRVFNDYRPPLFSYMMAPLVGFAGLSVMTARLSSAFWGILSLAVLYWAGSLLFNLAVGLTAAFSLAIDPWHVHYDDPAYANYQVLQMDWGRTNAYCQWLGKRLPTEAEWEKAARGDDMRPYPWGFDEMTCEKANVGIRYFDDQGIPRGYYCVGDTAPVDSYPDYASPYGVLNMVGNAQEWVNDIYLKLYYNTSPYFNPQGPESTATNESLIRRGCWKGILTHANNWVRLDEADIYYEELNGFRCARTVSEGTPTPTPTPIPVSTTSIDSEGGIAWLAYPGHLTIAKIPENKVAAQANVTLTYEMPPHVQGRYHGLDHFFNITAALGTTNIAANPGSLPVELLLGYDSRGVIILDSLSLYRLDSGVWVTDGLTMTERLGISIGVLIDRPGVYGLLGVTNQIYLPHIARSY